MMHFTTRLKVCEDHVSFYFNRVYAADGARYHISMVGKDNKSIVFYMKKKEKQWHIVKPKNYPNWLVAIEPLLCNEIIAKMHCSPLLHY